LKCSLCEKEIEAYSPEFNKLVIDESHAFDLCRECVDKFDHWRGQVLARLFPSRQMKKRFKGR
jgi:uncharacterized protein with PIN domain